MEKKSDKIKIGDLPKAITAIKKGLILTSNKQMICKVVIYA